MDDTDFIYNDNSFNNLRQMQPYESNNIYDLNIYDYEFNSTITSTLFVDNQKVNTYDYTLVAYDGMDCIGYTDGL